MRRLSTSLIALAACLPLLATALPASATDLGGYDGGGTSGETAFEGLKIGGVAVVKPTYEGSDEYELVGFPYILPLFSGGPGFLSRIDPRGLDDVRFKLIERNGFVAGPLGGYNFGRDEDDGDLLEGLGDVDGGVVVGGFVGYGWDWLMLDASYHHTLGNDDGYQIRFGLEAEKAVTQSVTLTGRIGATYADDSYMQNYFGVTPAQAAAAPFVGAYDADASFKDVHAKVGLKADLDANWSARVSLRYSRLLDDAADSPIVESEDQFTGLIGLSYRFNTGY